MRGGEIESKRKVEGKGEFLIERESIIAGRAQFSLYQARADRREAFRRIRDKSPSKNRTRNERKNISKLPKIIRNRLRLFLSFFPFSSANPPWSSKPRSSYFRIFPSSFLLSSFIFSRKCSENPESRCHSVRISSYTILSPRSAQTSRRCKRSPSSS